jgi:prepilin-type processing-associated H-X9-DG protein
MKNQPKNRGVWDCPENPTQQLGYSYIYNEYLSMRTSSGQRIQQESVANPSRVYNVADEISLTLNKLPHGTGGNVLMVDGHVEFVRADGPGPLSSPE